MSSRSQFKKGKKLGKGTYGIVYSAISPKGGRSAIKYNLKSVDYDFANCVRELNVNNRLSRHPHVIPLNRINEGEPFRDPMSPLKDPHSARDKIHFIYPLATCNLKTFIDKNGRDMPLSQIRNFMTELLLAVQYVHGKGFLHRDIKSENIMILNDEDGIPRIRLGDFGLSKPFNRFESNTPNVATCIFRAPEIVLGQVRYGTASDMWSVGCVFYELVALHSFIDVSKDDNRLILRKIVASLPYEVSKDLISKLDSSKSFRHVKIPSRSKKSMRDFFMLTVTAVNEIDDSGGWQNFCDFMLGLLQFDPGLRSSARQALQNPFFDVNRRYIEDVDTRFPSQARIYPICRTVTSVERKWFLCSAFAVYRARSNYIWYSHRILFHSIAFMDRALLHLITKREPSSGDDGDVPSLSRERVELYYTVALYFSIKYFNSLQPAVTVDMVATPAHCSDANMMIMEQFEEYLIRDILRYDFYHKTLYDVYADRQEPNDDDIATILVFIINNLHRDKTAEESFSLWNESKDKYEKYAALASS